jgi:hypothetical protein|tara:strand:+ start:2297 stop:2464 length:168 start_codon:yes stop_codon:yes gene_type:complete
MKKKGLTYRNPVARSMLEDRQSPKVIPPKKGSKAKRNRKEDNKDALRDTEFREDH